MFEPRWELRIGNSHHQGNGLLAKLLWGAVDSFDSLNVVMGRTQIIALPKQGKIVRNLVSPILCEPGKLIWFRRMRMEVGNGASKTYCNCYGIGIQSGDSRIGYRLYADGRVEEGLG